MELYNLIKDYKGIKSLIEYVENHFKNDLKILASNEDKIKEICMNSTIHTNKFAKIILHKENGYKVRLHIWPLMDANQYHEPHNHRWDFDSYVLNGVMVNRIVNEVGTEKTFLKCKSLPMKIGSTREYKIIGPTSITKVEDRIIKKGEAYEIKDNIIHIAKIPANEHTMTLFITHPPKKDYSDLYMPNLQNPPSNVKLKTLTSSQLKNKINEVINIL